jgi:hypothetical protein
MTLNKLFQHTFPDNANQRFLFVTLKGDLLETDPGWIWDLELMAPIEKCLWNRDFKMCGKTVYWGYLECNGLYSPLIAHNKAGPNGENLNINELLELYNE